MRVLVGLREDRVLLLVLLVGNEEWRRDHVRRGQLRGWRRGAGRPTPVECQRFQWNRHWAQAMLAVAARFPS